MKFYMWILFLVMSLGVSSKAFSLEWKEIGFPFKGFVYNTIGAKTWSDISNVNVKKDTAKIFEFTYQGKSYRAELYVYGAIYLEREGQNPLLLSFDIRDYRYGSRMKNFWEY